MQPRVLLTLLLWGALALPLAAQPAVTFPQVNDPTIGTVANKLAKITPTGAVLATDTDKNEPLYVVVSDAGKAGQAILQLSGMIRCTMETTATNTRGQYVVAGKDGACRLVPTTQPPAGFVVGQMQDNSSTAGATPGAVISAFQVAFAAAGTGGPPPAAAAVIKPCSMETGSKSSGNSPIPDDDDMTEVCGNYYDKPWTITAFVCKVNVGTAQVSAVLTGGSATSILKEPVVCTTNWTGGNVQGTPTVQPFAANKITCPTAPCTVDVNMTKADGTAKRLQWAVIGTVAP